MSGLARYIYDLSDKRLAKDVATDKQKWAVEICEQYATDEVFDWEHGTMLEMQRFLDKYFEIAKEYYDEWMRCWLQIDDCW